MSQHAKNKEWLRAHGSICGQQLHVEYLTVGVCRLSMTCSRRVRHSTSEVSHQVWCLPVQSAQCLGRILQLPRLAPQLGHGFLPPERASVSNRLTSSGHMFFHLPGALHQIMNCVFSHRASDCFQGRKQGWYTQGTFLEPASHNRHTHVATTTAQNDSSPTRNIGSGHDMRNQRLSNLVMMTV